MFDFFFAGTIALAVIVLTILIFYSIFYLLKWKINWAYLVLFAVFIGFASFWAQKIHNLHIVRGDIAGRIVEEKVIIEKRQETSTYKGHSRTFYKLCYREAIEKCVEVDFPVWIPAQEGKKMSVISIPGDESIYHTSDPYVNSHIWSLYIVCGFCLFIALNCLIKLLFPTYSLRNLIFREKTTQLFDEN